MTIRRAVEADRHHVLRLLRDFHAHSGLQCSIGLDFDAKAIDDLFTFHLTNPGTAAFVYLVKGVPRGVLLALAFKHPFGGALHVASERVWWVDEAYRGPASPRMLSVFEDWGRESGCGVFHLVELADCKSPASLYKRRGYRPAEIHHVKVI